MLIHAYRRKASITVDLFGAVIAFEPNSEGDVVAAVADGASVDRLLSIRDAYREYGAENKAPAAVAEKTVTPVEPRAEADPLVLVNDKTGEKLDIGQMTAKQVRAMAAKQKPAIELPAGNSTPVAELRALLAKGLKGE